MFVYVELLMLLVANCLAIELFDCLLCFWITLHYRNLNIILLKYLNTPCLNCILF